MPRGDRTGPFGSGPRSGRGAGYCGGTEAPGFANRRAGAGFGPGAGRGWRHWFAATGLPGWLRFEPQPDQSSAGDPTSVEKETLSHRMDELQQELELVRKRLDQLRNEKVTEQ
jgi:hypothetical protein